jgi:hypothetical protein
MKKCNQKKLKKYREACQLDKTFEEAKKRSMPSKDSIVKVKVNLAHIANKKKLVHLP